MRIFLLNFILLGIALLFMGSKLNAQWIQSGPYNNNIFSFEQNAENLFAGAYNGDVFLSSDNGANWIVVNDGLFNTYVSTLAKSNNYLFAGTDDGIFFTSNNGSFWNHRD